MRGARRPTDVTRWRAVDSSLRTSMALVLIGVLVVLTAWWHDTRDRADVGPLEVFGIVNATQSTRVDFQVPGGRVSVDIEVGTEAMIRDEATDPDSTRVRAPRGGRLVRATTSSMVTDPQFMSSRSSEAPTPAVWLRAAGKRYALAEGIELGRPGESSTDDEHDAGVAAVAVPTLDRNLVIELDFAGKRQSLDIGTGERRLGAFAPLYRKDNLPPTGLAGRVYEKNGLSWFASWSPRASRTPYLAELGWAKAGREWLTVTGADLRISSVAGKDGNGDRQEYDVKVTPKTRGSLSVAGARVARAPSTKVWPDDDGARYRPGDPVYDIPVGAATTIRVSVRVPLQVEFPDDAGRHTELVVTRSAQVEAVADPGADR